MVEYLLEGRNYFTRRFNFSWEVSVPNYPTSEGGIRLWDRPPIRIRSDEELFEGLVSGRTVYLWSRYNHRTLQFEGATSSPGLSLKRFGERFGVSRWVPEGFNWQEDLLFIGVWSTRPVAVEGRIQSFYNQDDDDMIRGQKETGWTTFREMKEFIIEDSFNNDGDPSPGLQSNAIKNVEDFENTFNNIYLFPSSHASNNTAIKLEL